MRFGAYLGLAAAGLFGVSTPLAKLLLAEIDAALLAGLLYLGAGVGLGLLFVMRKLSARPNHASEAALSRTDAPWLAGAVIAGGIVGPVLLMIGLSKTTAANASLMLNSESVLTAVLAWTVFRENFDWRILIGMLVIVTGAVVLSWAGQPKGTSGTGELLIAAACLAWAVDNNLTRKISGGDPQVITIVKGFVAGTINTAIALATGARLPSLGLLLSAGIVGFVGYGLSLQLYVHALRYVGTARTGAYFSVAPFAGAAVSLLIFHTEVSVALIVAAALMGVGVLLHLSERHEHEHMHDPVTHDHRHSHDEHHHHAHEEQIRTESLHSHTHHHSKVVHKHPHYPDLHHRHRH